MPQIALTGREKALIEEIASDLDALIEEFFADARAQLSGEGWELLLSYARACIRRAVEIGGALHAIVDSQPGAIEYRGRGRSTFVRQALAAWQDSFAPVVDVWRLAPVFEAIPGGEKRVLADVATLEVIAANRLFRSLDEQCADFLARP